MRIVTKKYTIDATNAGGPLIVMALWGFAMGFITPHNRCPKPSKPLTPIEIQHMPAESDSPPLERGR